MLRYDRAGGIRLLAGLVAGEVAAAVLLAVPGYLLAIAAHAAFSTRVRLWVVAVACVVFAVADLANRTPHVWRQVPQSFIRQLPPGLRGIAWGFDLGLLFSTQKVASLVWLGILAAILILSPGMAAAVIIGIAVLSGMAIVALSVPHRGGVGGASFKPVLRRARFASGLAMLALFALTAVQAWPA
jgi:hypothetical protein